MPSSPLPDTSLDGRTAIVTGGNSGIGLQVATALAERGAHLVLAVRDPERGARAAAQIPGSAEVRILDLADPRSVRAFADGWDGPLHLLVNNAGISTPELRRTADGRELQFATNHLGPFALTNLLLPHITGRVVTLASLAERQARLDFDDLDWRRTPYKPSRAYANSKQANLLFTAGLQRRLTDAGSTVRAMAAHPGFVATSIYDETTNPVARLAVRLLAQDAHAGAQPVLLAALADLPGDTFTGPRHLAHMRGGAEPLTRSKTASDPELADRLWAVSEELTGVGFPLRSVG
ncbi:SDR family NAD(P)-dependent oxidoreductase [Jatrophihabitans sp. YIM 134969]